MRSLSPPISGAARGGPGQARWMGRGEVGRWTAWTGVAEHMYSTCATYVVSIAIVILYKSERTDKHPSGALIDHRQLLFAASLPGRKLRRRETESGRMLAAACLLR